MGRRGSKEKFKKTFTTKPKYLTCQLKVVHFIRKGDKAAMGLDKAISRWVHGYFTKRIISLCIVLPRGWIKVDKGVNRGDREWVLPSWRQQILRLQQQSVQGTGKRIVPSSQKLRAKWSILPRVNTEELLLLQNIFHDQGPYLTQQSNLPLPPYVYSPREVFLGAVY